ncbi:MAG: transglycosylase SLT domain-containing protein [Paracoccus sp. (in: a-proteobacteria)]|nr:transglycosylase SLT domain-containing protein [Paracoccus sp. (in: a-proteobacteria)]
MNRFLKLAVLCLVASCGSGGGNFSAPRDLENACAIVAERPAYWRAMQATERRWGVPVHVQMATIHQESRFVGDARTPHQYALGVIPIGRQSSAFGYSQALDGTWDEYVQQTGNRRARRDNINSATDFMGWYMDGTTRQLGISKWDARNQYLAYHEGRGGYRRGSHNSKPWLLTVASRVEARSRMYQQQLIACGRVRAPLGPVF